MKCSSCGIGIDRAFKAAISKNVCPACSKPILASGNLSAFVPLCELINHDFRIMDTRMGNGHVGENQDAAVEALATLIISTFNVRLKSDKEEAPETTTTADPKQKQALDEKAALQKLREEALNEAVAAQWGLTPEGEESLDPDVGEALAGQMMPETGPNAGQALIDQKKNMAYTKMVSGLGKVRRGT